MTFTLSHYSGRLVKATVTNRVKHEEVVIGSGREPPIRIITTICTKHVAHTSTDVTALSPQSHVAPYETYCVARGHGVGIGDVGRVQFADRQHLQQQVGI